MARDWKGGNASTFKTIGASNHCDEERADKDYYATEPAATEWLCQLEQFSKFILEPSCGEGHMSEVLKAHGYNVTSRDLADRGFGEVADFLSAENRYWIGDIVTNPPYAFAQEFVEKAMQIVQEGSKVAMFLKLTFLEGKGRARLFEIYPPVGFGCLVHGSNVPKTATSSTVRAAQRRMRGSCGRRATKAILRYGGLTKAEISNF